MRNSGGYTPDTKQNRTAFHLTHSGGQENAVPARTLPISIRISTGKEGQDYVRGDVVNKKKRTARREKKPFDPALGTFRRVTRLTKVAQLCENVCRLFVNVQNIERISTTRYRLLPLFIVLSCTVHTACVYSVGLIECVNAVLKMCVHFPLRIGSIRMDCLPCCWIGWRPLMRFLHSTTQCVLSLKSCVFRTKFYWISKRMCVRVCAWLNECAWFGS